MLQTRPELHVVAEVGDGLEAVQKAKELQSDLILLDIGLPSLDGLEAANRIRQVAPDAGIIFLTQKTERRQFFGGGELRKLPKHRTRFTWLQGNSKRRSVVILLRMAQEQKGGSKAGHWILFVLLILAAAYIYFRR